MRFFIQPLGFVFSRKPIAITKIAITNFYCIQMFFTAFAFFSLFKLKTEGPTLIYRKPHCKSQMKIFAYSGLA